MKVRELHIDSEVKVFVVVNKDNEDVLEWEVEATQYSVLPDEEGNFFVKGLEISNTGISEVYYKELADLYEELGNTPMKEEYNLKYIENGGL